MNDCCKNNTVRLGEEENGGRRDIYLIHDLDIGDGEGKVSGIGISPA